jgi:hypothetical protein
MRCYWCTARDELGRPAVARHSFAPEQCTYQVVSARACRCYHWLDRRTLGHAEIGITPDMRLAPIFETPSATRRGAQPTPCFVALVADTAWVSASLPPESPRTAKKFKGWRSVSNRMRRAGIHALARNAPMLPECMGTTRVLPAVAAMLALAHACLRTAS